METQQTEYKTLWKDDYLKWICGFANAQGGVLSVVDENHESDTNVVDNVTMNATTMSQHFNVSRRTIMRDIDILVSKGLIKRVGSKMKGHWEIISK